MQKMTRLEMASHQLVGLWAAGRLGNPPDEVLRTLQDMSDALDEPAENFVKASGNIKLHEIIILCSFSAAWGIFSAYCYHVGATTHG